MRKVNGLRILSEEIQTLKINFKSRSAWSSGENSFFVAGLTSLFFRVLGRIKPRSSHHPPE